jgi:hypothetical protein
VPGILKRCKDSKVLQYTQHNRKIISKILLSCTL